MLHIMMDVYDSKTAKLNNLEAIYETIYKVTNFSGVKTVMPPILVPYYYGKVKEDDGISAFVFLKGGHFTIHTFPEHECYFVDLLYDKFVQEDKLVEVLSRELPFEIKNIQTVDRRFNIEEQFNPKYETNIDVESDFGPHYLIKTTEKCELSIDRIYHFLDALPKKIHMDSILRPIVITDKIKDHTFISGINVIAQSHIAVHYNVEEKLAYIDVFSCSFIDCNDLPRVIESEIGVKCECVLIGRGSKHASKITTREEVIERYNKWQENIL